MTIVSLSADEYGDMLQKFTFIGIVGGTIYDALLATCALKAKAETLLPPFMRNLARPRRAF